MSDARCRLLHLAIAAIIPMGVHATAQGAVKLDNMTFDKMVSVPGLSFLVKFDKTYAYGEKEDAFKELCKTAFPVKDFLIGEVPVQEYGDKENEDVAERFKVNKDEFPAYFLFKGSVANPVKFEGFPNPTAKKPSTWDDDEDGTWEAPMIKEPTAENLIMWLRKYGIKMPSIGTVAELDELAAKFLKSGFKDADLEAAKALAEGEYKNDKKAPIYVKIMEKVKAKGVDYVQTELARVQKLLAGKITDEKKGELTEKVKILNVFTLTD